jgi:hypothetical protein
MEINRQPVRRAVPPASPDERDLRRYATVALCAVVGGALAGAASTQPRSLLALLTLAGLGAAAWLAVRARGVLLGLLLLAVANALPGVDLGSQAVLPGGVPVQDLAIVLVSALLAERTLRAWGERARRPWVRRAVAWGCVLAMWWWITWVRSVVGAGITPLDAALFGRDFLFFALLVPLALAGLDRRDLPGLAAVVLAGGMLTALGQIATVIGGSDVSFLVHVNTLKPEGGLTRVYSQANDLVIMLVPLGLGLVLLARTVALRRVGIGVTLVAALATALMQTRAIYATVPTAILALSTVLALKPGPVGAAVRAGARRVVVGAALGVGALALAAPQVFTSSTFGRITERAFSGLGAASEETGTVAYRAHLDDTLLQLLGGRWLIGMGFLHPKDFYVAGVPFGTIRNSDLGVLEAIMPMGVIGTVLLYVPPVVGLCVLTRRLSRAPGVADYAWLTYGVASWILSVLLGSITLVTLFNPAGLTYVALMLAAAAVALDEPRPASARPAHGHSRTAAVAIRRRRTPPARRAPR